MAVRLFIDTCIIFIIKNYRAVEAARLYLLLSTTANWRPGPANRLLASCPFICRQRWKIISPVWVRTSNPPTVVGFLDWDYRYKSLAICIFPNAVLVSIPYTGQKLLPHRGSNQPQTLWPRSRGPLEKNSMAKPGIKPATSFGKQGRILCVQVLARQDYFSAM